MKLINYLIIPLLFSGCATLDINEEKKVVFENNSVTVKETQDNWIGISSPKETPFFGKIDSSTTVAGTFIYREDKNYVEGFVNMIGQSASTKVEVSKKENTELGRWKVYSCENNSTEIKGVPFSDKRSRKVDIASFSNKKNKIDIEYQEILKEMNEEKFIFIPNQCLYIKK